MVTLAGDSTAATSSSEPSTTSGNSVVCHRHGLGERHISGTDANPFRRFIRCLQRKVSGCDFFRWVDEELMPHYLASVQRLKQQKEFLESQLECKAVLTDVLYDKIKLKDEEFNRFKHEYASKQTKETVAMTSKPLIFSLVATGGVLIIALLMINQLF
ncbi:hypothetical protein C2S53_011489 [Perilla frutescens var. hirtella]|uniref:Zinc finger GRF-type domain-containing protein n=1 Tax=Perilla frutescens var. hirtella TaxID=608512 RepID=A0AAD4J9T8_PERFH|nr:hypothetical protein C2S53_011489 [Perilla frutescens var. hirtella]